MPFRNTGNKFFFRKGTPKYFAIQLCREAQKRVSPVTARFDVYQHAEDPTQMIAELSSTGASMLKTNLEEITQQQKYVKFSVPKHGLEYFANHIMVEKDLDVIYCVSLWEDKYSSRIDVYGNDKEILINTLKKYYSDYFFDIPQIFSLIIMDKMECKLPRDQIDVIACGGNSIVFPRGESAEDFMTEFNTFFEGYVEKVVNVQDATDDQIINACRAIDIKDVYYHIKNGIVILKGFEPTINMFAATIELKLDRTDVQTQKSEKRETLRFNCSPITVTDEEIESFSEEISFGVEQ